MWVPFLLVLFSGPPDLAAVQSAISQADGPGGYYTREYRRDETGYWRKIQGWITRDAGQRSVRRVLDVGCGYGTLLAFASLAYHADGYCLDRTDYLKPSVSERYHLTFARINVELQPIPWSGFDTVIMTEVLEHFNFQPVPTLKKIYAAMAPGAVFFLSTPDQRDWGKVTRYYRHLSDLPMPDSRRKVRDAHIWIYSKQELVSALTQAGFRIDRLDYSPGNGNRHFNVMAVKPLTAVGP